jgi:hypothetical protein
MIEKIVQSFGNISRFKFITLSITNPNESLCFVPLHSYSLRLPIAYGREEDNKKYKFRRGDQKVSNSSGSTSGVLSGMNEMNPIVLLNNLHMTFYGYDRRYSSANWNC